jgi:lipopolysaccharide export system permease protein
LSGFINPVLRFAWPILLAIAALALVVWPWAARQTNMLRSQYEQRGDLDRVSIGQFQENSSGSRVFFVEASDREDSKSVSSVQVVTGTHAELLKRQARNIFVSETDGQKQVITSARSGAIDRINEDQFVVLRNGQRMEQSKGGSRVKVIEFEEYAVLANTAKLGAARDPPAKSIDTLDLLAQPTNLNMAELSWRLGLALTAFNLLFLALLLSAVNPRAGRGFGIAFALLAFVVYYNLLNVGYSRITNGSVSIATWMLALHGSVFVLTIVWMAARHNQWSWHQLLPRRAAATPLA